MNRQSAEAFSCAPVIDDENFRLRNGIEVTLTNENIEDIEADVVVIGNGGDAFKSLETKGGSTNQSTMKTTTANMKTMSVSDKPVFSMDAFPPLKCKKVYLATVSTPSREASAWPNHLKKIYNETANMAKQDRVKAVAVVLIGAGKAGGPTKDSVRAALEAFSGLTAPGCLSRLLLVERDERRTREAKDECEKWRSERPVPPQ